MQLGQEACTVALFKRGRQRDAWGRSLRDSSAGLICGFGSERWRNGTTNLCDHMTPCFVLMSPQAYRGTVGWELLQMGKRSTAVITRTKQHRDNTSLALSVPL